MKIQAESSIRINEQSKAGQVFKGAKPGTIVEAKILERSANNEALIQINGRQFRAKFQNGLPRSNLLTLVLNERKNGFIFFSLKNSGLEKTLLSKLTPFLAGPLPKLSADLYRYLRSSPSGLFELNQIIYRGQGKLAGEGLAALFNAIMRKTGYNPIWLQNLAYYLNDSISKDTLFALIYAITGAAEQERRRKSGHEHQTGQNKNQKTENDIKQITETIDNIIKEGVLSDKQNTLITGILDLLAYGENKDGGFELPFFDGIQYAAVKSFSCGDHGWIFQTAFSATGLIEILAKSINSRFSLEIYVENDDLAGTLEKEKKEILRNIGVTNMTISVHKFHKFFSKMLDIKQSIVYTGVFDTLA